MFTYVTSKDLDDINTRIGGISCIHYHNGLYIQSARFVLKRIAGIGLYINANIINSVYRSIWMSFNVP